MADCIKDKHHTRHGNTHRLIVRHRYFLRHWYQAHPASDQIAQMDGTYNISITSHDNTVIF